MFRDPLAATIVILAFFFPVTVDAQDETHPSDQSLEELRLLISLKPMDDPTGASTALRLATDGQLEALVASEKAKYHSPGIDLCLSEVIQRGGAHWEKYLKNQMANPPEDKSVQFQILTALRRIQKKVDPCVILVEGKATLRTRLGYPPTIVANITNLDFEKTPVSLRWAAITVAFSDTTNSASSWPMRRASRFPNSRNMTWAGS